MGISAKHEPVEKVPEWNEVPVSCLTGHDTFQVMIEYIGELQGRFLFLLKQVKGSCETSIGDGFVKAPDVAS